MPAPQDNPEPVLAQKTEAGEPDSYWNEWDGLLCGLADTLADAVCSGTVHSMVLGSPAQADESAQSLRPTRVSL